MTPGVAGGCLVSEPVDATVTRTCPAFGELGPSLFDLRLEPFPTPGAAIGGLELLDEESPLDL
jgi:hypothetical protein